MHQIRKILSNSGISFGTSGARGLVKDFSDENCAAYTQAFLSVLKKKFQFSSIAIGIDNRPSSKRLACACAGMSHSLGLKVKFFGVLPTPAIAFIAMEESIPAIIVTGSHIPFDRNGLKFYRPDGEITKEDEKSILSCESELLPFEPFECEVDTRGAETYMSRYLRVFPKNCLKGKHIGVFEHSSAGRDLYGRLFERLGARVTTLERTESFIPIDTEAVSIEDKLKAKRWSKSYGFDAIFSTDGDGDRPLIADEKGSWLRGDIVGLLTANILKIDHLAIPISCNTAIERSGLFKSVYRTKIGSPYVIDAFSEFKNKSFAFAGFEANGGFLLGSSIEIEGNMLKALPTRDAMLPGLALLSSKVSLSKLVSDLPKRYTSSDRIKNVPTHWSNQFLEKASSDFQLLIESLDLASREVASTDQTDGLRVTFKDGDILHLRPSGNAPELRCYAEADSINMANALVQNALSSIKEILN